MQASSLEPVAQDTHKKGPEVCAQQRAIALGTDRSGLTGAQPDSLDVHRIMK